ncbi:nitrate- and nitrite sensing domain-containing protein [Nocardia sp. NPDC059239]|uniref:sensor histidine kinase n=1 Tax=unclassified Nocardia TaxID=2637762 RepID=UPI00368C39D0
MQQGVEAPVTRSTGWARYRALLRFRPRTSIRSRVLAIALIPSIILLITGSLVVVSLARQAQSARDWSQYQSKITDPSLGFVSAAQDERTDSLLALAGSQSAAAELAVRRNQTTTSVADLGRAVAGLQDIDAGSVSKSSAAFKDLSQQLQLVRQSVDTKSTDTGKIDSFYSQLVAVVSAGVLESAARNAPNHESVAQQYVAAALLQVADLHSRAVGLAAFAAVHGNPDPAQQRRIAALDGAFEEQAKTVVAQLPEQTAKSYRDLSGSRQWQLAALGRETLAEDGTLSMPYQNWLTAEKAVDDGLLGLLRNYGAYTFKAADTAATDSLTRSIVGGAALAAMTLAALWVAATLANRLVTRLRNLRSRSLELAEEELPSLMQRIHNGEDVDIEAETTALDTRPDEIGQVAAAFISAQRTALAAAVGEARTRSGFGRVFLDIANRNQAVVRRQLQVLDAAESKQTDPEQLQYLFDLDHLTTRARRNAENLLILGGGEAARRWRKPVSLEEIVRSAVSETEHLTRVGAVRVPEVWVEGRAVADLVHLLAELIDNATDFSPPEAPVSVYGNVVGRGVAVEIEDQGLGIRFEERERLNELLRNPPDFHEMALAGRRNLGLFVVGRLARRQSLTVSLQESAYGGIKAITLIPEGLLRESPSDAALVQSPDIADPDIGRSRARPAPATKPSGFRGGADILPATSSWEVSGPTVSMVDDNGFAHSSAADSQPSVGVTGTEGRTQLPRRQRQKHLKRELRVDGRRPEADVDQTSHDVRRTPDAARGAMASFQRGTRQGRASFPSSSE